MMCLCLAAVQTSPPRPSFFQDGANRVNGASCSPRRESKNAALSKDGFSQESGTSDVGSAATDVSVFPFWGVGEEKPGKRFWLLADTDVF